jgi:hypothetical protein
MERLRLVAFRFGRGIEIRYLTIAPAPGHFVTHGNEVWVVLEVTQDGVGTVVVCEVHGRISVSAP